MKDSLFKLNRFNKILSDSEKNDMLAYSFFSRAKQTIEDIIIQGDESYARSFISEVRENIFVKNPEAKEQVDRLISIYNQIMGLSEEKAQEIIEVDIDVSSLE